MPKKAGIKTESASPKDEEKLLKLLKKIYYRETPLETKMKEANEPLYLIRYE